MAVNTPTEKRILDPPVFYKIYFTSEKTLKSIFEPEIIVSVIIQVYVRIKVHKQINVTFFIETRCQHRTKYKKFFHFMYGAKSAYSFYMCLYKFHSIIIYPTEPSRVICRSFWASTANSIGSLFITSFAYPLTIRATASSVGIPR